MKLKPLADKLVVKMEKAEEATKSGIILTTAAKENPQIAKVIAVGPGGIIDGKEVEMTVSIGDNIVINQYSGSEIKLDEDKFVIIKISDVLAIVE